MKSNKLYITMSIFILLMVGGGTVFSFYFEVIQIRWYVWKLDSGDKKEQKKAFEWLEKKASERKPGDLIWDSLIAFQIRNLDSKTEVERKKAFEWLEKIEKKDWLDKRLANFYNHSLYVKWKHTTPFFTAIRKGNILAIHTLAESGVNPNLRDGDLTPLLHGIVHWSEEEVLALINNGADCNLMIEGYVSLGRMRPSVKDCPPLHLSIIFGKSEAIVKALLAHGANINAFDGEYKAPLDYAYDNKFRQDIITLLQKHGGKIGVEVAMQDVKRRIAENKDVNPKGKYGETPLHIAAKNGWKAVVALLLKNGTDVNVKDNDGETPLDFLNFHNNKANYNLLQNKRQEMQALLLKNGGKKGWELKEIQEKKDK